MVEEYHAGAASQSSGSEWKKAFEWEEAINLANTEVFHNTAFRTSQREIINATMAGRFAFLSSTAFVHFLSSHSLWLVRACVVSPEIVLCCIPQGRVRAYAISCLLSARMGLRSWWLRSSRSSMTKYLPPLPPVCTPLGRGLLRVLILKPHTTPHGQVTALGDVNVLARYLSSESTKTEAKAIVAGINSLLPLMNLSPRGECRSPNGARSCVCCACRLGQRQAHNEASLRNARESGPE